MNDDLRYSSVGTTPGGDGDSSDGEDFADGEEWFGRGRRFLLGRGRPWQPGIARVERGDNSVDLAAALGLARG